jgi:Transposase IS4
MGLKRYEQIHRLFSLDSKPPPPNTPWFYRVQRISELLRTACRQAYSPSSNIAIDEAMVAFKGRSRDTIKIKNKPVNMGYISYGLLVTMNTFGAGTSIQE